MTEQQFQEVLARYLDGEASPAECKLVDDWYRSLPTRPDAPADLPAVEVNESMQKGLAAMRKALGVPEKVSENNFVSR